jgi:myo-inositol 2-dehydrogenase/D-chiro-inositol 1-dehydrogenase
VGGVYDLNHERAAQIATACGGALAFPDPQSLITDPRINAVLIAAPDQVHAQLAIACIQAGKQVLCEKPLGITPDEARAVVEAERARGKHLLSLGFMRRFDPQHTAVKEAVASGAHGRALLFKGYSREIDVPYDALAEVIFVNSIIHDFDAMRWLLQQEVTEVYVRGLRSHADSPSEDLQLIQLTLTGNCLASIEVYSRAEYGYDISAEVVCERGVISTLGPELARTRAANAQSVPVLHDWLARFQTAYVNEVRHWVNCLRTDAPFQGARAEDGLRAAEIAEACIRSLRSGVAVRKVS